MLDSQLERSIIIIAISSVKVLPSVLSNLHDSVLKFTNFNNDCTEFVNFFNALKCLCNCLQLCSHFEKLFFKEISYCYKNLLNLLNLFNLSGKIELCVTKIQSADSFVHLYFRSIPDFLIQIFDSIYK